MVLLLVALVTLLLLTFIGTSTDEQRASSLYGDGVRAEALADSAVNLVIALVREATSDPGRLWASQPGAIRTFAKSGEFLSGYKLYSDDFFVVPQDEDRFAFEDAEDLKSDWSGSPHLWVDMNEPVIRDKKPYFPIADPSAKTTMAVEGFDFSKEAVPPGLLEESLLAINSESLPMPVKWIYQLADGTLGVLDGENEFVVKRLNKQGEEETIRNRATKSNPIVARIAYWTDDETAKVNINTASEPTFWDTPRASSRYPKGKGQSKKEFDDRHYGWSQPAAREYSRYPGHPAQTALSTIFFPDQELEKEEKEILILAAPQQAWGGSKAGTLAYIDSTDIPNDFARLYPSVDEYLLTEFRKENRLSEISESDLSTADLIERSRFFLTASSRAPELNAFNRPKVSIWPTHVEMESGKGVHRTAFDEIIRFCSSYGPGPDEERYHYSFQRQDSDSARNDYDSIDRNREVYEYLREMTRLPVPGYGGTFEDKWQEDSDQILTEIFDYIRMTNLFDENLEPVGYSEKDWIENGKASQFTDGRRGKRSRASFPGHGQVLPLEITDPETESETRGIGRFYTISEVGFMLICCADAGGPDPENPSEPKYPKGVLKSNTPGGGKGKNRALPRELEWNAGKEERCLQGILLFELFCPAQGWTQISDDMTMRVEFEDEFSVDGETLSFPGVSDFDWKSTGDAYSGAAKKRGGRIGTLGEVQYSSMWGGTVPFWAMTKSRLAPKLEHFRADNGFTGNEKNRSEDARRAYPFISVPFIVKGDDEKIDFGGGKFKLSIYHGTSHSQVPAEPGEENLVQTFQFNFPSTTLPIPELAKHKGRRRPRREPVKGEDGYIYVRDYNYDSRGRPIGSGSGVIHPSFYWVMNQNGCGVGREEHNHANWGGWRGNGGSSAQEKFSGRHYGRLATWGNDWRTLFIQGPTGKNFNPKRGADVVRTLVPRHGDYRLIAATGEVGEDAFVPHRNYFEEDQYLVHQFTSTHTGLLDRYGKDFEAAPLVSELSEDDKLRYHPTRTPDFPETEESLTAQKWGDFDNGVSVTTDGPYINKPDEGNGRQRTWNSGAISVPYFDYAGQQILGGAAFFSPNRQVSSPVMFGSLPTGVKREKPWETLLFRPDEEHPGRAVPCEGEERGSEEPPDHAILDWFWMPVVEPYAISEPFSTAGKINLNYQMLPFSHIKRATGLAAVMKSEKILAVPNWVAWHYKRNTLPNEEWKFRYPINFSETAKQCDERFEEGKIFRSATEVCELYLVPEKDEEEEEVTLDRVKTDFWSDHALTGDNSRERPYSNLYPRLTTKSNTFRVHYRVQIIKQSRSTAPGKFDPQYDTVAAEARGDCLFERYLDQSDPELPDFASDPETEKSLLDFYQYRIISKRRFAP